MAIADIVTRGFGSFSSVNTIPTRGYGIGAAAETYLPRTVEVDYVGPRTVEVDYVGPRTIEVSYQPD